MTAIKIAKEREKERKKRNAYLPINVHAVLIAANGGVRRASQQLFAVIANTMRVAPRISVPHSISHENRIIERTRVQFVRENATNTANI